MSNFNEIKRRAVVFVGPPGSGKGTQAALLVKAYKCPHYDMGAYLRKLIAEAEPTDKLTAKIRTVVEKGNLLDDDTLAGVFERMIADAQEHTTIVIDGIPRSTGQADAVLKKTVEAGFTETIFIFLDVPEEISIDRLTLRGKTSGRKDDAPEAIPTRLTNYKKTTAPVVSHLKDKGAKLLRIDGSPSIGEVGHAIADILSYE